MSIKLKGEREALVAFLKGEADFRGRPVIKMFPDPEVEGVWGVRFQNGQDIIVYLDDNTYEDVEFN